MMRSNRVLSLGHMIGHSLLIACRIVRRARNRRAYYWVCATLLLCVDIAAAREEIVVTARKKTENLQDVPLSIIAVDSQLIERAGIRGLKDAVKFAPSVQFDESFSENDTRVTIRGLSNTRGRSNVAFLVDGIDITSESTGFSSGSGFLASQRLLNDIERIEIVKGPQSALYGRSAFAGAINYITKEPGDAFDAQINVDLSEEGSHEVGAALGGPIVGDTFSLRINGVVWDEEGQFTNAISGNNFGGSDGYGVAATAVIRPADRLTIKARAAWSETDNDPRAITRVTDSRVTLAVPQEAIDQGVTSTTSVMIPSTMGGNSGKQVLASENPRNGEDYRGANLDTLNTSLIATLDLDIVSISSYTGFTDSESQLFYDNDRQAVGRPDTLIAHDEMNFRSETQIFSQELRLASAWDGPVQVTVGGLYWADERKSQHQNIAVSCFLAQCTPDNWQEILLAVSAQSEFTPPIVAETTHWSIYGLVDWDFAPGFTLTVEGRYVDEKLDLVRPFTTCFNWIGLVEGPCSVDGTIEGKLPDDYFTPKISVEWRPNDNAMLYVSGAAGQKPSGVNLLPAGLGVPTFEDETFPSEKVWAYEFGAKTNWNGKFGDLMLNGALFFQDYTDKQVATQVIMDGILTPRITNAGSASVWGIELEANWQTPVEGLTLMVAYTWLEAKYDSFLDPTSSAARIAISGDCEVDDSDPNEPVCVLDISGNQLERTPENALAGRVNFTRPLPNSAFDWFTDLDFRYEDERFIDADNFTKFDEYWQADFRLGITNERWNILLYIENLFDDDTLRTGGSGPDFGANVANIFAKGEGLSPLGRSHFFGPMTDPRTLGVRINFRL